jgi:hypothetical protein
LRYGQAIPSTRYDPETLEGWGRRPYNWEFSTGIQQEVAPRVGVDVSYFRRWYGNFTVTDNEAVAASDFGSFTVTAPVDPLLPDGGGYTVGTLYDVNPDKVGRVDNYVTRASFFGKQIDHWNGVDITVNARPREGMLLRGGLSTGRRTTDTCELREELRELEPTNAFCRTQGAFVNHVKLLGTYLVPKIDVQVAATFQNLPGPEILANTIYTNAMVQGSLGRPLSGGKRRPQREQQLRRLAAADEHPGRASLQAQRAARLLRGPGRTPSPSEEQVLRRQLRPGPEHQP